MEVVPQETIEISEPSTVAVRFTKKRLFGRNLFGRNKNTTENLDAIKIGDNTYYVKKNKNNPKKVHSIYEKEDEESGFKKSDKSQHAVQHYIINQYYKTRTEGKNPYTFTSIGDKFYLTPQNKTKKNNTYNKRIKPPKKIKEELLRTSFFKEHSSIQNKTSTAIQRASDANLKTAEQQAAIAELQLRKTKEQLDAMKEELLQLEKKKSTIGGGDNLQSNTQTDDNTISTPDELPPHNLITIRRTKVSNKTMVVITLEPSETHYMSYGPPYHWYSFDNKGQTKVQNLLAHEILTGYARYSEKVRKLKQFAKIMILQNNEPISNPVKQSDFKRNSNLSFVMEYTNSSSIPVEEYSQEELQFVADWDKFTYYMGTEVRRPFRWVFK